MAAKATTAVTHRHNGDSADCGDETMMKATTAKMTTIDDGSDDATTAVMMGVRGGTATGTMGATAL